MTTVTVGERIRAWRTTADMSERDLADKMGLTPPAIYQWERHGKVPSLGNLEKLVEIFGITMERFYGPLPKAKKAKAS
jgi:transcriptional regulator with XRE-family HTH domain